MFGLLNNTIATARSGGSLQVADMLSTPPEAADPARACRGLSEDSKKDKSDLTASVLLRRLAARHSRRLVSTGVLFLLSLCCSFAGPLLIFAIVTGLSAKVSTASLYGYTAGLLAAPLLQALIQSVAGYELSVVGVACRTALMAAVYRKCLRLNGASLRAQSVGKIVTLLSSDAAQVQGAVRVVHELWAAPVTVLVVTALLYLQIGWASFVALVLMAMLVPGMAAVSVQCSKVITAGMPWTDQRVSRTVDLITGIRTVKLHAWEAVFWAMIQELRQREVNVLFKLAYLDSLFGTLLFAGPTFVGIITLALYAMYVGHLNPARALTSLALISLMRFAVGLLPQCLVAALQACISLARVADFLQSDEVGPQGDGGEQTRCVVEITAGSFAWGPDDSSLTLAGIDLRCAPGELTVIVGSVGCGKSSLLAALMQHICCVAGTACVRGSIAYVPQKPWIMNATVRDNVLMGLPMELNRCTHALAAAHLDIDVDGMEHGDLTEIGERGVTLSGGQQQRLAIARAVFAEADVVLLDDPLSAVDAQVGRDIFEDCIRGALAGRTVVLVTHALHLLHGADRVIWMHDGEIRADATFLELQGNDAFAQWARSAETSAAGGVGEHETRNRGLERPATTNDALECNPTGKEERIVGGVDVALVLRYFRLAGGLKWGGLVLGLYILDQSAKILTDGWLTVWVNDRLHRGITFYLLLYASLAASAALCCYARLLAVLRSTRRAGVQMHDSLLEHVLRLPMRYFDQTPSGRIINRFATDIAIISKSISWTLVYLDSCVINFLGTIILISIVTPTFLVVVPFILTIYAFVWRYYAPLGRELHRLEAVTRSPIYTSLSEALDGLTTIRAFGRSQYFIDACDGLIRDYASVSVTQAAAEAWLSIRLDLVGIIILVAAAVLTVAGVTGQVDPALAGLSLTYALDVTQFLKLGTTMACSMESDFSSVERVVQCLDQAPESAAVVEAIDSQLAAWPPEGAVKFDAVTLRYSPDLPLVLKGVSFTIEARERVGIVGRTGSGKSSLFAAIFRLAEVEGGRIVIDGVDIRTLGLHLLRSRLDIIPQEPFIFAGTVRANLDPFERATDQEIWLALDAVGLKAKFLIVDKQLDHAIADELSHGERQLLCIARSVLRGSRILLVDEATASVDAATDVLLQRTIRDSFRDCTVLTIAHRLNTVIDSDRIMVMDAGIVAEQGPPAELLRAEGSRLSSIALAAGVVCAA